MSTTPWPQLECGGAVYEYSFASSYVKLRVAGAGKNFLKQWRQVRGGEAFTAEEAQRMVVDFLDSTAAVPAAGDEGGLFESLELPQAASRKRRAPDRLQPDEPLSDKATGERWKRKAFNCEAADGPCTKRLCIEQREKL